MNRPTPVIATLLLACLFLLAGCAYHTTHHDVTNLVPPTYGDEVNQQSAQFVDEPELAWWRQFDMPELDTLLNELSEGNYDLEIARQRLVRAQALLGQQRARNWPSLDASVTGSRTSVERSDDAPNQGGVSEEGTLAFSAAYEVDLWRQRSAANRTTELEVVAEQAQFRSVALSLQAQLAQQYFDLLSLQDRVTTTEQNLAATEELLNLVQLRFDAGRASGIELDQQRTILLDQRSQLLILQRDLALSERALAVLLGRDKLLSVSISGHLDDASLPVVGIVQPASLLESRPDIMIAEAELRISDALVFQNKAKRWPSLRLSGEATLADLFSGNPLWTTSLVGQLAAPLFNAGRIKNEIRVAEADASIALQSYRKTVIQAIQEALDTLTELNHQREIYAVRSEEVETNRRLYDLARIRFDAGNVDFINLLDAQRSWFAATERVVDAKRDHLVAIINTFRAMGVPPAHLSTPF